MQWQKTAAVGVSVDSCYTSRGGDYVIYRVGRDWMVYDGHGHLLQALVPSLTVAKAWCEDHQRN